MGAPDLSRAGEMSPIRMATALWNHGPVMLKTMEEQQVSWPRFQPGEIVDLMEYLNSMGRVMRSETGDRQ